MAKILIVDDEEGIRMLYAMELQDEGYEVITLPGRQRPLGGRRNARTGLHRARYKDEGI